MTREELRTLLERVSSGEIAADKALKAFDTWPYLEAKDAKLDVNRRKRRGLPEVVYCEGKTPEQVREIFAAMVAHETCVLGTRADRSHFEEVRRTVADVTYDPVGRLLRWSKVPTTERPNETKETTVAVVSAGTTDEPVLRETVGTLEAFGYPPLVVQDSGVAGLQRILSHVSELNRMTVVIVVAGMDGALPSVVAGLISSPVIAVPTSVGYGANFGGLSALLAMLNNCSGGITVVNIDNGFGAAYAASLILRKVNTLGQEQRHRVNSGAGS